MIEFIFLFLVIFLFWVFLKLADAHNEHWMKSFPGAAIIYWIIWWIIWCYLITYSQNFHTYYIAVLFYWIYKLKLDYTNHAIAWLIMLSWAFLSWYYFDYLWILWILWSVIILDYIKIFNKTKWKNKILFKLFKIKPQFFIWPFVFMFFKNDYLILAYLADFFARYLTIKIFNINQNIIINEK